jgi:hypothetical protein
MFPDNVVVLDMASQSKFHVHGSPTAPGIVRLITVKPDGKESVCGAGAATPGIPAGTETVRWLSVTLTENPGAVGVPSSCFAMLELN